MSHAHPTVSVIVPVYNGESFLEDALNSIVAQGFPHLQILVVDDGSTDASSAVAVRFANVTVLQQPHSGLHAALNHGLRCAVGDFITFLDADDRWLPGKLARQLAAFQQNPGVDLVFGQARQFATHQTADGSTTIFSSPQLAYTKITLMTRRAVFQRVGAFDAKGLGHDFLDWFARVQRAGLHVMMLPDLLAERRIHTHNHGRTHQAEQQKTYLHTLRAIVQQRRLGVQTSSH